MSKNQPSPESKPGVPYSADYFRRVEDRVIERGDKLADFLKSREAPKAD